VPIEVESVADSDECEKLELELLSLVEVGSSIAEDDNERLVVDEEDVDSVDSAGIGVFVVDSVVAPTGIMVKMSGIEDELRVSEV
jgi:anti-anti-sigma regulatory factor